MAVRHAFPVTIVVLTVEQLARVVRVAEAGDPKPFGSPFTNRYRSFQAASVM
jgi:hypothetical protein